MRITMVCWGNICRSPMAERILQQLIEHSDIPVGTIEVDSVGMSSEEIGNPIDYRAQEALERAGYHATGHTARQVTRAAVREADLLVVAEPFHLDRLRELGAEDSQLRLMTDFDPKSTPGSPLPDPWYGGFEDFDSTLSVLERAMPELLKEIAR